MLLYNVYPKKYKKEFTHEPNLRFTSEHTHSLKPRIDISETAEDFSVVAELAGIPKENINISVDNENILTIKGERNFENGEETQILRNEITKGNFERKFELPEEIERDQIKAKFDNGLVMISIPKKEPVKPKEIELELA